MPRRQADRAPDLQHRRRGRLPALRHQGDQEGRTEAELTEAVGVAATGFDEPCGRHLSDRTQLCRLLRPLTSIRKSALLTGSVCGVRIQSVEDPLMRQITLPRQVRRRPAAKASRWPRFWPRPGGPGGPAQRRGMPPGRRSLHLAEQTLGGHAADNPDLVAAVRTATWSSRRGRLGLTGLIGGWRP